MDKTILRVIAALIIGAIVVAVSWAAVVIFGVVRILESMG